MDDRTQQLDLTAPIPTGNTKAAAAAAGATSADLWMVPYEQLHYDPADNIRPVDTEWVAHLAALMRENGYDKGSPLHCYARKVDGKDLLYVYKGQHRYLAAGHVIKTGKKLGKIPVVVRAADTVNRADMVIDGYLSNDSKRSSPLELAGVVAELRDIHGMTLAAICKRLHVTDQTVRDVGLLERAPLELHQLVRDGQCTGTLAIEQIRQHGADKALERIVVGISKAAVAGKSKVTKKYLEAAPLLDALPDPTLSSERPSPVTVTATAAASPASTDADTTADMQPPAQTAVRQTAAPAKISEKQSKQLLQALQFVLHDPRFGKLARPTIEAVHSALMPLSDLLDGKPSRRVFQIEPPDANGDCQMVDVVNGPAGTERTCGRPLTDIYLAQPADGVWIYANAFRLTRFNTTSRLRMIPSTVAFFTRGQAIRAAATSVLKSIDHLTKDGPTKAELKDIDSVVEWACALLREPDPDWTDELAITVARGHSPDISPATAQMTEAEAAGEAK
ncbi:ParB/RepB/Spo0J family partition protein [Burkholderia cepacia]|uniref:ParB/RepB/Spo0J family partition protein n=1 Tax=Burkholderia cepacia TaxID=292 RepID=UPI001FC86730|nr:pyridoxal phosphate biosynthetic protein PdxJ [Burkholderia cepacia]